MGGHLVQGWVYTVSKYPFLFDSHIYIYIYIYMYISHLDPVAPFNIGVKGIFPSEVNYMDVLNADRLIFMVGIHIYAYIYTLDCVCPYIEMAVISQSLWAFHSVPENRSGVASGPVQLAFDWGPLPVLTPHHDNVIKWKHFPRYWPFVQGIHRSPVNSPHKGQWRGALMFSSSLICVWINGWVNNREAGDLRRYRAHYDVIVMDMPSGNNHPVWSCYLITPLLQWHHDVIITSRNTVWYDDKNECL